MTRIPHSKTLAQALLEWYRQFKRPLPWRESTDPYLIWVTEIIFQQTRIEQGMGYFHRFMEAFPDVHALANAPDDRVMKLWEGLGYYNRARNLLSSARVISHQQDGAFPDSYDGWLAMKGVGAYTAAIISSVCFNEPRAAVDGNVFRVLSRYFADPTPIDHGTGKRYFRALADELIDPNEPGNFNQALMDLGAMICTPRNPDCSSCPIRKNCQANALDRQADFPVKSLKKSIRTRHLNYFKLESKDGVFVKRRSANDIWPDLYEYPMIEGELKESALIKELKSLTNLSLSKLPEPTHKTHQLTHQKLIIKIYSITISPNKTIHGYQKKTQKEINNLSFPKPLVP